MEPPEPGEDGTSGMESWHQLPAEEDPSQFLGHTTALHEITCQRSVTGSHEGELSITGDTQMQRVTDRFESLQLEFQDSRLSPALTLIPQENTLILSESTLLHQTDSEFVPLRGSPDLSIASGGFPHMSHLDMESVLINTLHEQASLSQHPLGVIADISESDSSCCSLSQHSLSPSSNFQVTQVHEEEQGSGPKNKSDEQMEVKERTDADVDAEENVVSALSGGTPVHSLLDHLEKDVSAPSSSAVSAASGSAFSQREVVLIQPHQNQSEHADLAHCQAPDKTSPEEPKSRLPGSREPPQGGSSSLSFQSKTTGNMGVSLSSLVSTTSNITVRSSSMQPTQTTDVSHRLLLSYSQSDATVSASEHTSQNRTKGTPNTQFATPASGVGVPVPGLQRVIWASGSLTAADGSFLTSQPVSQSTPAVLLSRTAAAMTKLSPVHSRPDSVSTMAMSTQNSCSEGSQMPALDLCTTDLQTIPGVPCVTSGLVEAHTESGVPPLQPDVPDNHEAPSTGLHVSALAAEDTSHPPNSNALPAPVDREFKDQVSTLSAGKVRSLPTLSYLQKVDAWKANQSSSKLFYDNLGLQEFENVPPKRKMQDSLFDGQNNILAQQSLHHNRTGAEFGTNTNVQAFQPGMAISSGPDRGTLRQGDQVTAVGNGAPSSASPLAHSHSHSSLSTVVTSIQLNGGQHNLQHPLATSDDISPHLHESSLLSRRVAEQNPVDQLGTGPVNPSALISLGQFSDVSSNPNVANALSSSQGSCQGEQSFLASVGAASSVVSLEVDNYAPYWTSRPGSPPLSFEINIEDRIPMYLHNLGIDQSPSTILNPFTPRGPIREPEFSPTDLCTIKDSVGTPAKSTQPSEGESPQKETFSSSSLFSVDSSASLTQRLTIQRPDRPASQGSVRMVRCQVETTHDSHTLSHQSSAPQESGSPQREGSYGLPARLSLESVPHPGAWPEAKEADSSLVGSGTLQEIRRLLGRAESLVSGHSSLMSSPGSHCYSESNASFLSLRQNAQAYLDDSSLSVGGKISPGLARSSSDSALKESSSSSYGPLQLSTHITTDTVTQSRSREENLKSRDLRVAPRRTEPEGCSAADPDKVGPVGLPAQQGNASSASDDNQQSQESTVNAGICSPENSPTHSLREADLGVLSDSSSESSLAARVAKLLQSESPVSVVTSRPSTTDPEESRAREWIMMKVSGRQCEALELNMEDRKRIEEIKRELLLHTKHSKWSSDSEGSVQSSISAVPKPAVGFAAMHNAEDYLSEQLQRAARNPLDSTTPSHTPFDDISEARVHQMALRDRLNPTAPLTSITIATTRRTPSPQLLTQPALEDRTNTAPQQEDSCTPTHSMLKSTDEEIRQTFVSDREVEIEQKGTVRDDKEGKGADDHENDKESEKMDWAVVQDVAYKNLTGKKNIPPNLVSGLVSAHKSQMSQFHLTLSPKPQQSVTQRLRSPTSEARTLSELQLDLHTHYSDRLPSQNTQRGIPPLVSISSEEKPATVISETSASENRRAGQHSKLVSGFSQISSRYPQTFTPPQRLSASTRPLSVHTAAVPTLLPYKPHGSTELFYMPQTDPEVSPAHSVTTMESSHTGSDDALPPHFTTEVLGSRELDDKNVTPKHKEGIYSKRTKMNRESTVLRRDRLYSKFALSTQKDKAGSPYQLSVPSSSASDGPDRGQGIVHSAEQAEEEEEEFVPLHMEADHSTNDLSHQSHTVRKRDLVPEMLPLSIKPIRDREQSLKTQELGLVINSSLDQLWRRFSERYSLQESQPSSEAETSLLERLERLSRLLHSTTPPHTPAKQARSQDERGKIRRRELELRRAQGKETSRRGGDKDKSEVKVTPKIAWEEDSLKTGQTLEEEQENANRCPAERDESASISVETSSSQSTIDTERLLRAFGPHRVYSGSAEVTRSRTSKSSANLLKLYNTINRQKGGHGESVSDQRESEVISTDESTASADSVSSSSTYTLPSQRAIARTLTTKRPKVKLVNRGVQAGDLEIVVNGTRRHTRDVGTTFPSPSNARDYRPSSSGNTELQTSIPTSRSCSAVPAHSQTLLRKEALHKSNQTYYPNGVSWFVSADELKQDARKENEPQPEVMPAASQAWIEPYTRSPPWKEPLREPLRERHLQPERKKPLEPKAQADTDSSKPSALVRLSLQEALELHRPEFMSRSQERMKRLCLLAEERKMQAIFNREREELFNRPLPVKQPAAAPPPMPSKRVIPMKEMVQRSKRIYAQLPEVQKRKQEEKRKAEYRTYRLNAQLFNKKVTNHVLGRRTPWQ